MNPERTKPEASPRTRRDIVFLAAEGVAGFVLSLYVLSTAVLGAKGDFQEAETSALDTGRMAIITAAIVVVDKFTRNPTNNH